MKAFKTAISVCKVVALTLLTSGPSLIAQDVDGPTAASFSREERFVPGRLLVKFKENVSADTWRAVLSVNQARSAGVLTGLDIHVVELPAQANERAFIEILKGMPEVEFAELDYERYPSAVHPNDPMYWSQGGLSTIKAPDAWSIGTGSSNITIALIDTGVNSTHQDLMANLVPGWNFANNNADTSDSAFHGTFMAGALAAATNNGVGVAGVCWNCKVMPLKVSNSSSTAADSTIASALVDAKNRGLRIAVIGFAVTGSASVTDAARQFVEAGGIVIAPAGNDSLQLAIPNNPYIVTVSGSTSLDQLFDWSNRGSLLDLAAPGAAYSTSADGAYGTQWGTSYSAAYAAGTAALIRAKNQACTGTQIATILTDSADDIGTAGWDSLFGWGRLNTARAIGMADTCGAASVPPPLLPPANLIASAPDYTRVNLTWTASAGASSYLIYRNNINIGTASSTSYADFSVSAGTAYNYYVKARDGAGNLSGASNTASVTVPQASDTTPPTAPTNLAATAPLSTRVDLTWTASTDNVGVQSYWIYRNNVNIASTAATSFSDSSVAGATTYSYYVKARDAAGNLSTASNTWSVTTPSSSDTTPPTTPTNLAASAPDHTRVNLTWTASTDNVGVQSYLIYRNSVNIGTSSANSYADLSVSAGTTYSYYVRARDAAGNLSNASNTASVNVPSASTTDTTPPSVSITSPAAGSIVPKSGSLTITASASDNIGVTLVTFFIDGGVACTDSSAPYSCEARVGKGSHQLTASARDAAGNSRMSGAITVTR